VKDTFEREITYLRISLTDLCNLRCVYCMPPEGVRKQAHDQILSLEEIGEIARAAVELGVKKIRLTGGEPLVRRGVLSLCRELRRIPRLQELTLTTNGLLLPGMAAELKAAGVDRVNVSLDTLDPEKYRRITRGGCLEDALAGIQAARDAGLTPLKLNCVLIGGFNDDEIPALAALTERAPVEVRFIELMPIGDTAGFGPDAYLPCEAVLERLPRLEPAAGERTGVAERFRLPGAAGTVGLIRPLSRCFCAQCDRIRLTADGYLKPCLHSREEISVRGLHGPDLRRRLEQAIRHKPEQHGQLSASARSESARGMNRIGG
jgi:cyclic pyranopterin phosphate synthase